MVYQYVVISGAKNRYIFNQKSVLIYLFLVGLIGHLTDHHAEKCHDR